MLRPVSSRVRPTARQGGSRRRERRDPSRRQHGSTQRSSAKSGDSGEEGPNDEPPRRLCAFCGKGHSRRPVAEGDPCSDRHADRDRQRRKRQRDRARSQLPPTPTTADFRRMLEITDEQRDWLRAAWTAAATGGTWSSTRASASAAATYSRMSAWDTSRAGGRMTADLRPVVERPLRWLESRAEADAYVAERREVLTPALSRGGAVEFRTTEPAQVQLELVCEQPIESVLYFASGYYHRPVCSDCARLAKWGSWSIGTRGFDPIKEPPARDADVAALELPSSPGVRGLRPRDRVARLATFEADRLFAPVRMRARKRQASCRPSRAEAVRGLWRAVHPEAVGCEDLLRQVRQALRRSRLSASSDAARERTVNRDNGEES